MNKTLKLLCALALLPLGLVAQTSQPEWLDPEVNAIGRLPMHANFFAYEKVGLNDKKASERYLSLEGLWKFNWVRHAEQRPTDFYRVGYNDSAWGTMPVPGIWEVNGYGDPLYVNPGYPWLGHFKTDPPMVPTEENHVGSYRREIEIPADWAGRQVIAHIGSATSNIALWVNGQRAGYGEDSKMANEFDITRYLKPGKNLFAMQIFRWSDGTYLEDQDFFRLSGIARECYLYARDRRHIDDVRVTPQLTENYTRGALDIAIELSKEAKGGNVVCTLLSPAGEEVTRQQLAVKGPSLHLTLDGGNVALWSAEIPTLYDLRVDLLTAKNEMIESIPLKVGFREVKIEDGLFKVNGKPVLIKGADRHELDPDGGYNVSVERMIQDIKILKENNFNAVRTCHYPDDPRWYDLCDKYGIYLCAEANIESHGMGYGDRTLAQNPSFRKAHLERNERHVRSLYNHPSVIFWSLGNEAGFGDNFKECYRWVKEFDNSRPVQYERAEFEPYTDIICPMYWTYDECEKYASGHPERPLIQCEYAHAMGNSMGGFGEYWDLVRKYPHYQGGFIWDFVDQSLRKTGKGGAMIYGYGGDWNPYDASDLNFCDNGLISPDRVPNPHMHEVAYVQQPYWTTLGEDGRTLEIYNENFFRPIENCYARWTVMCDGRVLRSGIVDVPAVAPQQKARVVLPVKAADVAPEGELVLTVEYRLKDAEPLLEPDHRVAYEQFVVRPQTRDVAVAPVQVDRHTVAGEVRIVTNDPRYLIIETPVARLDFARRDGLLSRYDIAGHKMLAEGSKLRPDFWRAPTDNDFGAGLQQKFRVWENPGMTLKSLEAKEEEGIAVVTAQYDLKAVGAALTLEYRINNAGEMLVSQTMKAGGRKDVPDLMRFGLRMEMPAGYDRIDYYGRGPWENYTDRKRGALLGRYVQTVDEQFYPYIRPQENGTKSDVRRWNQTDISGRGLQLTAAAPFAVSALHYTQESLDEGLEKHQMHSQEVQPVDEVCLIMDARHYGLGCINSWGHLPRKEYRMPYGDYNFTLKITPLRK